RLRWSASVNCGEYFSVASLYGGGQSIRSVATIFIVIPCWTRQYTPGASRSLTSDALLAVMKSPGFTCAETAVKDEPKILSSSIASNCPTCADGEHFAHLSNLIGYFSVTCLGNR